MTIADFPGSKTGFIGPNIWLNDTLPGVTNNTLDALNEAVHLIGYIETSDGGSHTINTTGSSSIQWRTGTVTFANAGTTAKVGIAAVDTAAGTPGRAVNSSNVITFDVSKSMTGGGGGITTDAWQTHVPDSGTKTIANGDLVVVGIQLTARAGVDSVLVSSTTVSAPLMRPGGSVFVGSYGIITGVPNIIISFSDGALGFFHLSDVASVRTSTTFSSASSPNEYGQLYNLPFSYKVHGIYFWHTLSAATADFDVVMYSDPLGTPVAEKTVSVDANTVPSIINKRGTVFFSSPYSVSANTDIVAAYKPGATGTSTVYSKTLNSAAHRIADPWGTSGYGVSRSSGAFANMNSSLDHVYIGLIVGGFDAGGGGGGGLNVLGGKAGVIA